MKEFLFSPVMDLDIFFIRVIEEALMFLIFSSRDKFQTLRGGTVLLMGIDLLLVVKAERGLCAFTIVSTSRDR